MRSDVFAPATQARSRSWSADGKALSELKKAVASGVMTRAEAVAKYKSAAALNDESGVLYATPWLVKHWKAAHKADLSYLAMVSVAVEQAAPVILAAGGEFRIQGAWIHPPTFPLASRRTHLVADLPASIPWSDRLRRPSPTGPLISRFRYATCGLWP